MKINEARHILFNARIEIERLILKTKIGSEKYKYLHKISNYLRFLQLGTFKDIKELQELDYTYYKKLRNRGEE